MGLPVRRQALRGHADRARLGSRSALPAQPLELEPRQRAIADFSAKLAQTPPQAGAAEIRALRSAGLSDSDIADLADAVAMFAWANRLMLTLGEPKRA